MYRALPGSDYYEGSVAIGVSLCRQSLAGGAGARANVSEPDGEDLPADTTTTGEVEVGGAVTSASATRTDQDWFAVDLEAGKA